MREKQKKPAILVFSTSYFPFVGGAEVAVREVARRFSGEFDYYFVTARFDRTLPKIERVPEGTIVRLGFGNKFDKHLLPVLGALWAFRRPGILFGLDISAGSIAPALVKLFQPQRFFVLNIQYGYGDDRLARGRWGGVGTAFRFMLRQANHVSAISSYLLNIARAYGYNGEASIIPNGVEKTQSTDFTKYKQNTKHKTQTIITASRLVPKNGVDILVDAMAHVKIKIPDARCIILGVGPEEKKLRAQAARLGIEDSVEFVGIVPMEEVFARVGSADVFVRPSRSEGMGNVFLEALSVGTPIVGTPVGGITDIIEDGKTGLFCEPENSSNCAEKILTLLSDKVLAQSIVAHGQKKIRERFLWEETMQKYRSLFAFVSTRKILIATGIYPPDIGGPATYSKLLHDELPKHGISVRVLSFGSVRRLPKIIRHIAYGLRLIAYSRKCDIIFAQDPVSVGFPAALVAKLLRKKFLLKVVGDYAWEQHQQQKDAPFTTPDDFQNKKFDFVTELRRKIEHFTARQARQIITPSKYLKKIVGMWGISPEKITVIYNAFATPSGGASLAPEDREAIKKKLGLFGRIIVSAGRNVPWKGFDTVRGIMPAIQRQFPDSKLFIFHTEPREKLLMYLRVADVFVLNTAYEGFSHQILEAMALGVPVVTTAIGGNPEIVRDGENGFLVEYNDGAALKKRIIELLENTSLAEKFSANARIDAAQFTKKRMLDGVIAALKNL